MEIIKMKLSDIVIAEYNPRKTLKPEDLEYIKMKRSLEEFGCVEPFVWNKRTKRLVGGHQRLQILKDIGVKEIEVSVVDLDETKEKILNIALNKIQGEWNFVKLTDLIVDINAKDLELDLELTGFDKIEIEDITSWTPDERKLIKQAEIEYVSQEELIKQKNLREGDEAEKFEKFNEGLLELVCPYCNKDFKIKKTDIY